VGWLYFSSGPAITSAQASAAVLNISLPAGVTNPTQLRIDFESASPPTLGFNVPASQDLGNY
jgi:hypothetical protein